MIKRPSILIFIVIICFMNLELQAQDFNNYKPLICKGTIPQDFKEVLKEQVEKTRQDAKGSIEENRIDIAFSELSNYQLRKILYSGDVLYGDKLTDYVNKVADIILENDKPLRAKLRFYVLRTVELNAYTTQKGIVFVSTGLLSQIESESQLAFILCHEIIHYKNNHNIESYRTSEGARTGMGEMPDIYKYKKENENEADREGLELYLKTPYGTGKINNLFDVLLYSYLPYDEIPFDSGYFNMDNGYELPGTYFPGKVNEISAEEDAPDSLSSHPNIRSRRSAIQLLLKAGKQKEGKDFILSHSEFDLIVKIARYEIASVNIQKSNLTDALYDGYLLEKIYGKSLYSDKIISAALYALSKQKYYEDDNYKSYKAWESIEGESQSVYQLIAKIPAKEIAVLCATDLYQKYKKYNDSFFLIRFKSAVYEMVRQNLTLKNFNDVPENSNDTVAVTGKVSKIKKQKKNSNVTGVEDKYYLNAFAGMLGDTLLQNTFLYYINQKNKMIEERKDPDYISKSDIRKKYIEKYGESLGIKKFILLKPMYSAVQRNSVKTTSGNMTYYRNVLSRNPKITPLVEVESEQMIINTFRQKCIEKGIQLKVSGGYETDSASTELFNEYQSLIIWLGERLSVGNMGMNLYSGQYIEKSAKDYGYLANAYILNVEKSYFFRCVLLDLKTGNSALIYSKTISKAKPGSKKSIAAIDELLERISRLEN
ncbi:MAG: M48 family metalloprotease [Bacteroidia bacterium]|nr:M48 family metalloprotease [Bacteroidia bacterium]